MTCPEWDVSSCTCRTCLLSLILRGAAPARPLLAAIVLTPAPPPARAPAHHGKSKLVQTFQCPGTRRQWGICCHKYRDTILHTSSNFNQPNELDKWRKRVKTKCQNIHEKELARLDIITRYFQHVTMWWWTTVTDWRTRTLEPALIHHLGFLFSVQNFGLVSSIVRPENSRTLSTHLKSSSWPHILLIFQSFYVK